jgi:hypothetical protein
VLVLMKAGIYEVGHSDGLRRHNKRTKFHNDRFRHLNNIKVITAKV